MIGLGIDLCDIRRIENTLQKGDSFLQRFFTAAERDYLQSRGKVAGQSAAAMFAAKEAFLKAVGTGLSGGISLREIGIVHENSGAPRYELTGRAADKMQQLGAVSAHLSLTHDAGMAAAVCIIE